MKKYQLLLHKCDIIYKIIKLKEIYKFGVLMGYFELIGIAIGLAMDAFAVSICKGLTLRQMDYKKAVLAGTYFGFFQMIMPLIGYLCGTNFTEYVSGYAHWVAFVLLVFIGVNMIRESFDKDCESDPSFEFKSMVVAAVATSIDALMVGVSFAFMDVSSIGISTAIIGAITFVIAFLGVKIGNVFGAKFKSKAELAGGIILILIGLKILFEGLGWLAI